MTTIQTAAPVYSAFPRSFASSCPCSSNHSAGEQARACLVGSCKRCTCATRLVSQILQLFDYCANRACCFHDGTALFQMQVDLHYSFFQLLTHKIFAYSQFLKADTQTAEPHTKSAKPYTNSRPLTQVSIS